MEQGALWGMLGIQTTVIIALLPVMIQVKTLLSSIERRLIEDGKEHTKIVEKLESLDDDVRELRRGH